MSYNIHKRFALDVTKPLPHRASHARSCAVHVSEKLHVHRDEIFQRVKQASGVDLEAVSSGDQLPLALASLDELRSPGSQD